MTELRPFDKDVEFLPRDQIEAMQLQKLKDLMRHVAKTNAFYGDMWRKAGVNVEKIASFADFRAYVPMVEKADFLQDQRDSPPFGTRLTGIGNFGARSEVYTTSGTSGQGVELHAQSKRELAVMERMYGHYFSWAGMKPGDITMLTLPGSGSCA